MLLLNMTKEIDFFIHPNFIDLKISSPDQNYLDYVNLLKLRVKDSEFPVVYINPDSNKQNISDLLEFDFLDENIFQTVKSSSSDCGFIPMETSIGLATILKNFGDGNLNFHGCDGSMCVSQAMNQVFSSIIGSNYFIFEGNNSHISDIISDGRYILNSSNLLKTNLSNSIKLFYGVTLTSQHHIKFFPTQQGITSSSNFTGTLINNNTKNFFYAENGIGGNIVLDN